MYLAINILGVIVFLAVGWALSKNRSKIKWRSVGIMVVLNLVIAWLLTSFSGGRAVVKGAADGFNWLVQVAYQGINFALPNWVGATGTHPAPVNFITSALLPILLIVPMFDILTYIGVLPWIIKWIGRGLSFITGQPKFESFFAVEMMFLGNTEALAVSKLQLTTMKAERDVTLAMMSMSCVTASILGAYTQMVPGQFVLTAVPLNCINALIVTNMLNPVEVAPEDDTIAKIGGVADEATATTAEDAATPAKAKREPFFSFLGDSILGAGTLVLIITANVIAFVALAGLIDKLLGLIWKPLSLESILGVIMFIPAWLLGLNVHTAWDFSQLMGLKLVTNEFVVMGEVTGKITHFAPHYQAVLTVFLTSFANFGTTGMIIGAFKGMVGKEKNDAVSSNVGYMLLSGILVSLLSAGMVGLFIW
ncbi:NupC/NupG family nucleoside CNT transporter [Furfurilactobacillus siliginis]|uniref:Nucleoside permease n=1 Tax=Furfurilactobacillus siliginis TaxID=348151 RepID=A0A0R2LBG7_9LACO|nr:nucleoside transporter C-terminal domain-containing protein [Furfurilactobacillus siliginis]KRN97109.1 nucleoside permease [Furfurilactobacillus siliginis]GEK29399.1 nucleoside transporter [Furfurilactobacillus siliginis]